MDTLNTLGRKFPIQTCGVELDVDANIGNSILSSDFSEILGLIRFDGCDTNVYHLVDETDPHKLRIGLPVEPVWREPAERTGSLADIRHFRPVYE